MRDGGPERPRCNAGCLQHRQAPTRRVGACGSRRGRQSGFSSRFGAAFAESDDSLRAAAGRDSGSSVCEADTSDGVDAGVEAAACGRAIAGVGVGVAAGAEAVGAGTAAVFGVDAGAEAVAGAALVEAGAWLDVGDDAEAGAATDAGADTGEGVEAAGGVGTRIGAGAAV